MAFQDALAKRDVRYFEKVLAFEQRLSGNKDKYRVVAMRSLHCRHVCQVVGLNEEDIDFMMRYGAPIRRLQDCTEGRSRFRECA